MFTSIYKHALKNLSCIIVKTDNVPSHQVLCLNQVRIWFWHHTTITRQIKSRSDVSILNNRDLVQCMFYNPNTWSPKSEFQANRTILLGSSTRTKQLYIGAFSRYNGSTELVNGVNKISFDDNVCLCLSQVAVTI